ncbi:MAG TPA: hypothetical protein VLX29_08765 [Nitrospirota bacterium]|nr:hypothetical protein [Nitrospirota bacterium]
MKKIVDEETKKPNGMEQGSAILNIGKIIFLITALVAAWFVLERFLGSK